MLREATSVSSTTYCMTYATSAWRQRGHVLETPPAPRQNRRRHPEPCPQPTPLDALPYGAPSRPGTLASRREGTACCSLSPSSRSPPPVVSCKVSHYTASPEPRRHH